MISLRSFTARQYYFIVERQIGWRVFSKIEFLQGYTLQAPVPRIEFDREAAVQANEIVDDKITSVGSQVEVDFAAAMKVDLPEWHNNPNPNANYDIEDPGYDVPEVFREHRHKYSARPSDANAYRKQIKYRCGHIGTKELEIVLRDWLELHSDSMSYDELEEFDNNILDIENPQLQRYLMNGDDILPDHDNKYMNILMEYMESRKIDYASNVPKSRLIKNL